MGCNTFNAKTKSPIDNVEKNLEEKPKILNISTSVIWDGQQTLGGNWVSHPAVITPEKVLIKNTSNGKAIVGAVFQHANSLKQDTAIISSDAANSLSISKNDITEISIVAVREAKNNIVDKQSTLNQLKNNTIDKENIAKKFIQVGIFSVENNAIKTLERMDKLNLPVSVSDLEIKGKLYWRVVVGPASTLKNRTNMINAIKSAGFTDAYLVAN